MILKFDKFVESITEVNKILLIVDVQRKFKEYFNDEFVNKLSEYTENFDEVYNLIDNHLEEHDKKNDEYLYDENYKTPYIDEIINFKKQNDVIEKRYLYLKDESYYDFFEGKLNHGDMKDLISKEDNNTFKEGDFYITKNNTLLVYVNNNHRWFECPKKLYNILNNNRTSEFTIVGGSDNECLKDILQLCYILKLNVKPDHKFIYSATFNPHE